MNEKDAWSWDAASEVGAVLRVELWAKFEYECDEPASEPADMLERGEDAVTDFEGRECSSDVSVAAAFMSTSSLPKLSAFSVRCGVIRLLLPAPCVVVSFRLPLSSLRLFVLAGAVCATRADLAALRGGVLGFCFDGGANGGSCGL